MRLPLEILHDIRDACGQDFLIGVRMGYNEPDIEGAIQIAKAFDENGADLLHISLGFGDNGFMNERILPVAPDQSGWNIRVWGAGMIRAQVSCPVLAVGGIRHPQEAEQLLQEERADLVAVGRGLLCQPEWVHLAQKELPNDAVCKNCGICVWSRKNELCPGKKRS